MLQNPQVLLPLALLAVATGSYVASVGSTSFVPSSVKPRRSQTTNPSARKRVTKMTTSSNTSTRDEIENYKGGDYKVFVGRWAVPITLWGVFACLCLRRFHKETMTQKWKRSKESAGIQTKGEKFPVQSIFLFDSDGVRCLQVVCRLSPMVIR